MRFAMILLALGLVMGAPIAPTNVIGQAHAQAATADTQQQLEAALAAQLQAAAGNPGALAAIVAREQAAGRGALLARALARAAQNLATAGNGSLAATLMTQAINIATGLDPVTQESVGATAGQVSMQLTTTDPAAAARIQVAAASSSSGGLTMAFASASQRNTNDFGQGLMGGYQQGGQQTGGQQGTQQTPVVRRTTRRTVVPPRPRIPTTPVVPVIVEPNPSQAGSPT